MAPGPHHKAPASPTPSPGPANLWGEEPATALAGSAGRALGPIVRRLRKWDASAASGVHEFLANSVFTAKQIERHYGRAATVIYPPVDIDRFRSLVPNPEGHLVAIGELVPYKRFDLAVIAAVRAGRRLVVVGDGPDRARLERLGQSGDIEFAGRVPPSEVPRVLDGAAALIHPGIEPFGIVIVEALAAGIPVIASTQGGAAEIVQEGMGTLVDTHEVDPWIEAVAALSTLRPDPLALRARAGIFGTPRFRAEIAGAVDRHLR